jgi:N-ethylmaleimide reductase
MGSSFSSMAAWPRSETGTQAMTNPLFTPFTLGGTPLANRIVMASMTRGRATNPALVPTQMHVDYYRQRASAGLIMTEATWVSAQAIGSINVPGLYSPAQTEAWRAVTHAVHEAGGRIYAQLGHAGGASHPDFFGGALPMAPSAVNPGQKAFTPGGFKDTVTPRAMTLEEIARTIEDYAKAARNARLAGFDGVELHAATVYLLPQFLNSALNQREDRYGGSADNRARIVIEILEAMIAQWGSGKVGIKLAPAAAMGGLQPTDQTLPTYDHLVARLGALPLSHLQLTRAPQRDWSDSPIAPLADTIAYYRKRYQGVLIANGGYDAASAGAELAGGGADLVSFAAPFIANPDLVARFARGWPLSSSDRATYYQGGAEGYTTHPPHDATTTA